MQQLHGGAAERFPGQQEDEQSQHRPKVQKSFFPKNLLIVAFVFPDINGQVTQA